MGNKMKTEYIPFTENMIPEAGSLLAARHKRNRVSQPWLPVRFEDPQAATKAVEVLWQKKNRIGYAAFRDGRMVAYLIGVIVVQPWERCGYVYLPGYALAEGEKPSTLQDLYAKLGEDWVRLGVFSHGYYVAVADTEVVNALFNIGFGKERVDGVLDLRSLKLGEMAAPKGITIRQAGKGDSDRLGSLSHLIMSALSQAPYWHPTIPEDWEEIREGWAELPDEKDWTVWMALEKDEALGTIGFHPEEEDDLAMFVPPRAASLTVAATQPHARGRGISTSLTWHGLSEARKAGFDVCYTDWISPNLLASRFWPRFGFQEVAYRLSKRVSPMISWTRNQTP
jgi:GNAT superfamily N-acetyltransferase